MIVGLTLLALSISRYKPESTNTRSESLHPSSLSHVASRDSAEEKNDGLVLTRSRAFVTLCLGMTLALFAQTGVVTHLVSVLTVSMGRRHAGLAAGAAGFAAVVGRLLVNWRSPAPSDWRYIASFSLLAQITGCLVLLLANDAHPAFLIVGVIFFGLGVGNAISVPPVIANEEFTGVNARRVVALIVAISQGAYAFAPAAFGVVRDAWSDQSMFLVAAVIQLLAIASYMWDAGRLKNKRVREA
jgi:fucose permease